MDISWGKRDCSEIINVDLGNAVFRCHNGGRVANLKLLKKSNLHEFCKIKYLRNNVCNW